MNTFYVQQNPFSRMRKSSIWKYFLWMLFFIFTTPLLGANTDSSPRDDTPVLVTYNTNHAWTKNLFNILEENTKKLPQHLAYTIVPGHTQTIIDYALMQANHLSFSVLPSNTIYINKPTSLWATPHNGIIIAFLFVLLLIGLAIAYMITLKRRIKQRHALYTSIPARIGVINEHEKILHISANDLDESQKPKAKYLKDLPFIDYKKFSTIFAEVFKTNKQITFDYECAGTMRSITAAPLPFHLYRQKAIIWLSQDNSKLQKAHKQAEENRHQTEQLNNELQDLLTKHQILLNNMPACVFCKDIDDNFKYVNCNAYCSQLMGCEEKDIIGKTSFDFFSLEDAESFLAEEKKVVENPDQSTPHITFHTFMGTDGRKHHGVFYRKVIFTRSGQHQLFVLVTDVTELEEERKKAKENAIRFRLTLNSIGDGVIATDKQGNISFINPVAERMIGCHKNDVLNKPHEEIFKTVSYPDNWPTSSPIRRSLRTGEVVELANHTDLISQNGTHYHIADSSSPIRNDSGEIIGAILVFRDVTEDYNKREQLRTAIDFLEDGAILTHSGVFKMVLKSRQILYSTKEFSKVWPVKNGKAIPIEEWVHPEDVAGIHNLVNPNNKTNVRKWNHKYRAGKQNEWRYYHIIGSLNHSPEEETTILTGVIQDITELTQGERKLQETMDLWNLILNTTSTLIFAKDVENHFLYKFCNKSFADFVGHTVEEVVGKTDGELFTQSADQKHFETCDLRVVESGGTENIYESCSDFKGKIHHILTIKTTFTGADGKKILLGVSTDITQVNNLLESEHINSEVLSHIVEEPNFEKTLDFIATTILKQMQCNRVIIAKYNDEKHLRLYKCWHSPELESIDEELPIHHYQVWDEYEHLLLENKVVKISNLQTDPITKGIIYKANQQTKSIIVAPIWSKTNLWGALFVSFTNNTRIFSDIDERIMRSCANMITMVYARKLRGEAFEEIHQILQSLLKNLPMGVVVKDVKDNYRYLLCNKEFCNLSKKDESFLIGKNDYEAGILHDSEDINRALDTQAIQQNETIQSTQALNLSGEESRTYKRFKIPLTLTNGRKLLVAVFQDVTEIQNLYNSERITNKILQEVTLKNNFDDCLQAIYKNIVEQTPCDRIIFATYNKNDKLYSIRSEWAAQGITSISDTDQSTFNKLCCMIDSDMQINQMGVVSNTSLSSKTEFASQCGIKSAIAAPIFINNSLWGVLILDFCHECHTFQNTDVHLVQSMANIIVLAQNRELQNRTIARINYENQLILDKINVPIWLYNRDGKLIKANTAVCNIVNLSEKEILASPCYKVFNCNLHEKNKCPIQKTIQDLQTHQDIYRYKDKEYIITSSPVLDEEGNLLHVLESAMDVTELNTFIANEKVLNTCLEALLKGQSTSESTDIILSNICERFQASRCYIVHFENDMVYPKYEHRKSDSQLSALNISPYPLLRDSLWYKTIDKGNAICVPDVNDPEAIKKYELHSEINKLWRNQSLFLAGISVNNTLWGCFGITFEQPHSLNSQDIHFLKSGAHLIELMLERDNGRQRILDALEQAEKAEEQAKKAEKAKSFFIATISHELRTPLNSVIGFSELLRDKNLDQETQKEYLKSIVNGGNSLLLLVNDVLDLSKLEAGQMQFIYESTHFEALGLEVLHIFDFEAPKHGNKLVMEIAPMPILKLDKIRIRQILVNFVGNAVKFTRNGYIVLRAAFHKTSDTTGSLSFSVSDTGIGISKEDQKKLMEPFVQLSKMRGTNAGNNGTGLGLAISKRLIEKMGGNCWIQSEEGKGSTFGINVQNITFTNEPVPILDFEKTPTMIECPLLKEEMEKIHILLVDDVSMNLKVLMALCKKIKIKHITCVFSGAEALMELRSKHYDLVLTDMWMPEMDGKQLAENIKKDSRLAHIPIIFVTADVATRIENFPNLIEGVLLKPLTIEKLQKTVNGILEKRYLKNR